MTECDSSSESVLRYEEIEVIMFYKCDRRLDGSIRAVSAADDSHLVISLCRRRVRADMFSSCDSRAFCSRRRASSFAVASTTSRWNVWNAVSKV